MTKEASSLQLETASPRELLLNNIETERLETIPLASVISEDSIIDVSHAKGLSVSMSQKRGQLTPICVRARFDSKGEIVYDIIDGFHRTEGKKMSGDTTIEAKVVYRCPDEEMFDLRILAANSVRSIQFPRIINWMKNCFAETIWATKGLSVSQAFGMAVNDSTRSNLIQLSKEETTLLKKWVNEKCVAWERTVDSIYSLLRIAELANPELVREVRSASGGHSREITITQAKLTDVVVAFPGEGYWTLQRVLLEYSITKRLGKIQLDSLIEQLKGKIRPNLDESRYRTIVCNLEIPKHQEAVGGRLYKKDKSAAPMVQLANEETDYSSGEEPTIEELEWIELGENSHSLGSGLETKRKSDSEPYERNHRGSELATSFTRVGSQEKVALYDRIQQLENIIKNLTDPDGQQAANQDWWRTATYLTPIEQKCLVSVFGECSTLSVTATKHHLTEFQVFGYLRSAFAKHSFQDGKVRSGTNALLHRKDQEEF